MPVEHLVFFKLRTLTDKELSELKTLFSDFKNHIPGVLEASFGKNISPERANGYTHAVRVLMNSPETLKVYGPHQKHMDVKKLLIDYSLKESDGSRGLPCAIDFEI